MRTIHRATAAVIALLAAAVITIAAAAACSNGPADDADPPAWGPTYAGILYCGYQFTPLECTGHAGIPMLMPTVAPPMGTLQWALFTHLVAYHGYYYSPRRYDVVLVHYHVGGSRQAFVSTGTSFNRSNAKYEKTYTRTTITKTTTTHTTTSKTGSGSTTQRKSTTSTQTQTRSNTSSRSGSGFSGGSRSSGGRR